MNTTWDDDGLKLTVTVPLGAAYPASTLVARTLTAFLGKISNAGVVTEAVAASAVTSTETATEATITALWIPASVEPGMRRAQVIVHLPDKPYTVFDQNVQVLPSL